MSEIRRVLGLDLGTNSLGWCLLEENERQEPLEIVALGSRIFPMALEDKTPVPKNHARRRARLDRRRNQRRARRKARMRNYLTSLGFISPELTQDPQPERFYNQLGRQGDQGASDVYALRKRAISEPLPLDALAKIWMSFAARRGFQSARKTKLGNLLDDPRAAAIYARMEAEKPEQGEDSEEREAFQEIADLKAAIAKSKAETLGQFLADLPPQARRRGWRTDRQMYKDEFAKIWETQAPHHPELADEVRLALFNIIFNQRPIRFKSNTRGDCSLEKGCKRAARAWPDSQRFRYWHDIHNFGWIDPETQTKRSLKPEEKGKLAEALEHAPQLSWKAVKELLGIPAYIVSNLEEAKTKGKGLKGNRTSCTLRKLLEEGWDSLSPAHQQALVEDLLTIDSKKGLFKRLVDHWGVEETKAVKLCMLELEPGYMSYSRKAIGKILPLMIHFPTDIPWTLDKAVEAAGYTPVWEQEPGQEDSLPKRGILPNPIVNRSSTQMRKVVNAIIETYGKPDVIRLEMGRDLKLSARQKESANKTRKENERLNQKAEDEFKKIQDDRPDLSAGMRAFYKLKYRLWQEQGRICPYSVDEKGQAMKSICIGQLFSDETEVDHIVPYSRSMDDSFMNKVLCFRNANQNKGNRTPKEWLQNNPAHWEQVAQAAKKLSPAKTKRFFLTEADLPKDFLNSQLNDTRYVSREAHGYLKQLGCDVSITKGHTTARLRRVWKLNNLLDPSLSGEKNREDHRHHAVDACVIALTSRRVYQQVLDNARQEEQKRNGSGAADANVMHFFPRTPGMENIRDILRVKMASMVVSHATNHRLSGALHEDTAYGLRTDEDGNTTVVYRQPLDQNFGVGKAKKVADPVLREKLIRFLEQGGSISSDKPYVWRKNSSTDVVRRVKVVAANSFNPDSYLTVLSKDGLPVRRHPLGNNHHVEILRSKKKKGKIVCVFRTMHEAALRLNRGIGHNDYRNRLSEALAEAKALGKEAPKLPLIEQDHGPEFDFLMALHINDTVKIWRDEAWHYYRVQNLDATGNRLVLRHQFAATLSHDSQKIRMSIAKLIMELRMTKVEVSPIGLVVDD